MNKENITMSGRKRGGRRVMAYGLLTAGVLMFATDVLAQAANIVVTARRREENLQNIPLTVQAFDLEAIERGRVRDIQDVARLTPGLVFDQGFVPQDTRPQIRGLPATRGRPPVGVLIDGIDVSSASMLTAGGGMLANLRLIDAERIEVVKGPQSALYGRVAFGGAINYISKKPSNELEANLSFEYGNRGQLDIRGGFGIPIVEDVLAVRFNAAYEEYDGKYFNAVTETDVGGFDSTGVAIATRFTPNDRITMDTRYAHSEDDYDPRAQYLLSFATGQSTTLDLPPSAQGLMIPGFVGPQPLPMSVYIPNPGALGALDDVHFSRNPVTGQDFPGTTLDVDRVSNVLEIEFDNNITATSWTGWTKAEAYQNQDVSFFGMPDAMVDLPVPGMAEPLASAFWFDLDTTTRQINQEIRIGDLESEGLRWAVGGLYWDENVEQENQNYISLLSCIPFVPPCFAPPFPVVSADQNFQQVGPVPPGLIESRDTTHYSLYGILEWDVTSTITGTFEGRYSWEDLEVTWVAGGIGAFGPVNFGPVPITIGTLTTRSSDDSFFTPRIGVEWEANEDMLIYVSAAKGVKPGGISTIAGTGPDQGRFFPETLWNYEAGAKTSWMDDLLILNGALFYMDYKGKQATTLEPDPTNAQQNVLRVINAGAARVFGFELEATLQPFEGWTLTSGYTFLDTKYTDFTFKTTSGLGAALAGNCTVIPDPSPAVTSTCEIDNAGGPLERTPKHSMTFASYYVRALPWEGFDFVFDVAAQYQSKRFQDTNTYHFFDSYWNVDARAGVQGENFSVFVYGENVFDNDTVKSGQGTGDFFAPQSGSLAIATFAPDPAHYGVRVSLNY